MKNTLSDWLSSFQQSYFLQLTSAVPIDMRDVTWTSLANFDTLSAHNVINVDKIIVRRDRQILPLARRELNVRYLLLAMLKLYDILEGRGIDNHETS